MLVNFQVHISLDNANMAIIKPLIVLKFLCRALLIHTYLPRRIPHTLQKVCLESAQSLSSWGTGRGYHPESSCRRSQLLVCFASVPCPWQGLSLEFGKKAEGNYLLWGWQLLRTCEGVSVFHRQLHFWEKGLNMKTKEKKKKKLALISLLWEQAVKPEVA